MLFQDRHVVVTGGTGALGIAVVGALIEAGATCHVPYIHAGEA
jgi:NAD(P)-dependent dehydrogenase (short-subunit alcohol dehydrogenase family)